MTRPVSAWATLLAIASMVALLLPVGLVAAPVVLAADPVVVSSVDFDDGTTGTWTQSGSPTLTFVPDGAGGQALSILRAQDFEGIQSPTGLLQHDVVYTLSMRARLPEGTAGSTEVRLVVKPNFTWVGNAAIDGSGWTTISGTYTLPDEVDPSAGQVYVGSTNQAAPYTILVDDILITTPAAPPPTVTVLSTDFESGLDGWVPRGDAQGDPTVSLTTDESHSPTHAALVSDRTSQGDGIGHDVTGVMNPGTTYVITAWVKFAAGNPTDTLWLSMRRTNDGSDAFDTLGQFTAVSGTTFVEVSATYAMGEADSAFLYFESRWPDGTSAPFLVDDITVASQAPPVVEDLTPVKDTVDFPLGSAVDSRETTGASSELLLRHFDQVTPENHMKPEAWYDDARTFRIHPEAEAIMDFAQDNGTRVYGHTLVWHSQTPAWFFQREDGTPLTTSDADKALLRTRLHDHIFNVAATLSSMYGPFGSDTNPLVGFDVVNEAVSDGTAEADGLRRSPWYNVLGEAYIDDAFAFANEAFNDVYAADGVDRPVLLAINDYNTEQSGKRQRFHDLVSRLLARGIPVDAAGHQFHLSLSTPVGTVEEAISAFEDLPVTQVVSEMDVTTGTPVDTAKLIDQGYYYRDAFRSFRAHADDLFSVTLWGLHDGRSWRSAGAPLLFDANLKAKPAYFGAVDGELDARLRTAFVFQGSVDLAAGATDALEWQQLPLHRFGDDAVGFQLRWEPDHLTAYIEVADATPEAADSAMFVVDDTTYVFGRDGTGDVQGVVDDGAAGWKAVVHLPLSGAGIGDQVAFDVSVVDGTDTVGWNDAGANGTLTLVEALSFTAVAETATAPAIDGETDSVWAAATTVSTDKQIEGSGGASAVVRTLWQDNTLYVLAHVTDPILDDTGSDPWVEDSFEIYVDAGNVKNGSYRFDDTQIRINFNNVTSFGTGDEAFQDARLTSATQIVADGYVVEASISLLEAGGVGTFHGLDLQVNDATAGVRTSIRNWADPTGLGYQSTSRWGVGRLVPAGVPTTIDYAGSRRVQIGKPPTFGVVLSAPEASCVGGRPLAFSLDRDPVTGGPGPIELGEATTNDDGRAKLTVGSTGWSAGSYLLTVASAGNDLCAGSSTSVEITVTAKGRPNG
ncbi:MAG TPA: endo-1,4-beta-xylanase [Candidatus Limnocylindrales bacterium]|nr:endo-1,4-beta-xylanase [Candidatus Limnocylindrales bacterium]